jgi:hypothetical protein
MKNKIDRQKAIDEEVAQFTKKPNFAQAEEQIKRFITANYGLIPYTTSYCMGQKSDMTDMVEKLLFKNPEMTLSKLMLKVFSNRPDNMHPKLVKELTQHIFDEYERINSSKTELATTA